MTLLLLALLFSPEAPAQTATKVVVKRMSPQDPCRNIVRYKKRLACWVSKGIK